MGVNKETQDGEDKYQGVMSTANSQTPFLLPKTNSCSISLNGQAKQDKEKCKDPKPNILGLLGPPRDHSHNVASIDGNISKKGNIALLPLNINL